MTLQTAACPISVFAAAQERWAEAEATRLTCLEPDDRELTAAQLKRAGTRAVLEFTVRFAARTFSFAFWSGVVFASIIGAVLWGARIPSRHAPAAITAAAYLLIVIVATPACHRQARRILSNMERISDEAPHGFLWLYLPVLAAAAILYCIVGTSAFDSAATRHVSLLFYVHEFAAFAVVVLLGFVIAYLALAYAYAAALGGSWSSETISWSGALVATAVTVWFPVARSSPSPSGNPYLDSGLLRLLGCAVTINDLGHGQCLADPRTVRSVIINLELAAADIEQYALSRVPRSDTSTRRLARQDGVRLASVIREAKAPVAGAVHPLENSIPGQAGQTPL